MGPVQGELLVHELPSANSQVHHLGGWKPWEPRGEHCWVVYPHVQPGQLGQESADGSGARRLQVPFHAACPSLTAGPTGMRAELFVPGELLQPRER